MPGYAAAANWRGIIFLNRIGLKSSGTSGNPRFFYGWLIVGIAGLALVMGAAPLAYPWAEVLGRQFGWTRNQLSAPYIMVRILLPGLAAGYLTDRFGPRRVVVSGLFIMAGAWLVFVLAQNVWMYYGAFVFILAGGALSGWIPLMTIICRWFVRRRTVAIAITFLVSTIGAVVFLPVIIYGTIPEGDGGIWRIAAAMVVGRVLMVAVLALVRLRGRPADAGMMADDNTPGQTGGYSTVQTLRSRPFWFIVFGEALTSAGLLALSTHLYLIMHDKGFATSDLGAFGSIQSTAAIVFYLAGGLAGDRIAKRRAMAFFATLQGAGFLMLAFAGGWPTLYLAGALLGMGSGGRFPLDVAMLADYFGLDSIGKILAFFGLITGLFGLFAAPIAGYIYDAIGNAAFLPLLFAAQSLLGAFLFLNAPPPPGGTAGNAVVDAPS